MSIQIPPVVTGAAVNLEQDALPRRVLKFRDEGNDAVVDVTLKLLIIHAAFLIHPYPAREIRTKDKVSILSVVHSDGAIGDKFFTYHPLEFFVSRVTYHPLEPLSFLCLGNIMLGVTFKIVLDSIHQHALEVAASLDVSW